jgi:GNAT superfamily N-acetyltransferase
MKLTVKHQPLGRVRVEAHGTGGKWLGTLDAVDEANEVDIYKVEVNPALRRCGVGTRLYTYLAKWACTQNKPLVSDTLRSPAAEAFWAKQQRKARAICVPLQPGVAPMSKSPCWYYKLKCPVTSLAGARR